jgi:hypothetical protein
VRVAIKVSFELPKGETPERALTHVKATVANLSDFGWRGVKVSMDSSTVHAALIRKPKGKK